MGQRRPIALAGVLTYRVDSDAVKAALARHQSAGRDVKLGVGLSHLPRQKAMRCGHRHLVKQKATGHTASGHRN
jgi:hypothetical protein